MQKNESNINVLPGKEPPEGGRTLLEVENLKKYYPIKAVSSPIPQGIFMRWTA